MKSRGSEDPILSPQEMCADAHISEATWYRVYRYHPKLKIIWLSPRRIGARRSNWQQVLEEQAEGEAA
jgi:hypothetical protein